MDILFSVQRDQTPQGASVTVNLSGGGVVVNKFPIATVGKESDIEESMVLSGICHIDEYNLQIGNFCTLERGIKFIINDNHDYKSVTTGVLSVRKGLEEVVRIKKKGTIIIQNDVKIGCSTIIISGVTIQNGSIVLAESVVTKDVPAYAIVGGNPAAVVGYRFSQEQIKKLLEIQWWYWENDKLEKYREEAIPEINRFIEKYHEDAVKHSKALHIPFTKTKELTLFIPDFDSEYPIFPKVIEEFCNIANERCKKQFLILILEDANTEDSINRIFNLIDGFYKGDGDLVVLTAYESEIEAYISISDEFVTARNVKTVYYSSLAHQYGVKIISGTDIPVFEFGNIEQGGINVF